MARMRDISARPAARSKSSTTRATKPETSAFGSSKKDKRQIKHSSLISKIEKENKKTQRRRRPNKKLVATLDSLADALPDVDAEPVPGSDQVNIIRHKTVKSRPGAMKRKEKLEKGERERFTKNMAEMSKPAAPTTTQSTPSDTTTNRWAALRTFISGTLERLPEQTAMKE